VSDCEAEKAKLEAECKKTQYFDKVGEASRRSLQLPIDSDCHLYTDCTTLFLIWQVKRLSRSEAFMFVQVPAIIGRRPPLPRTAATFSSGPD
jgi:hypothetical protein